MNRLLPRIVPAAAILGLAAILAACGRTAGNPTPADSAGRTVGSTAPADSVGRAAADPTPEDFVGWTAGNDATVAMTAGPGDGPATAAAPTGAPAQVVEIHRPMGRQDEAHIDSAPVPANAGVWECAGSVRTDLYAQDMSFNATVEVVFLAADGKSLGSRPFAVIQGKTPWRKLRKRVEAPVGTAAAKLAITISKTYGTVWAEGLTLERVGDLVVRRSDEMVVRFTTCRMGDLLYPEDPAVAQVEITAKQPLAPAERTLRWDLRDYWGALQAQPQQTALSDLGQTSDGHFRYGATIDMTAQPLQVGPYYEIHTELALDDKAAAQSSVEVRRDTMSFAILPPSSTTQHDALESPFGTHSWDATLPDYFPLSARLGLRRCLVFWDWSSKPPYDTGYGDSGSGYDRRIGFPRQLGMRPYGILYPIFNAERGDTSQTDESLRAGVRESIRHYGPLGLWGFLNGNEPPGWSPEIIAQDVKNYRSIYQEVKKTDPNVFVIGTAVGPEESFFKAGFQDTQDAYNVHCYGDLGEMRGMMAKYKELFKKYGGEKPIYSTEMGSKSQGLSRHEIAMDLVRKAACFFADGGRFFTWFAVTYPDFTGGGRGSYNDSMNLFSGYLTMYQPRLDAIAYYHLVDAMADKQFVHEGVYDGGAHGFLFTDKRHGCLQIVWQDKGASDRMIPLPGVDAVRVLQIDGHGEQLDAHGKGVTLRLTEEPQFILYDDRLGQDAGADGGMAAQLAAPGLAVDSIPETLAQGGGGDIVLRIADGIAGDAALKAPPFWTVTASGSAPAPGGGRLATFHVEVPASTPATYGTFTASVSAPGELSPAALVVREPIVGSIQIEAVPLAAATGAGAMVLHIRNNAKQAQTIHWQAAIRAEFPMEGGTYHFDREDPPSAHFTDEAEGSVNVPAGGAVDKTLALADVDRLAILRVRASADADGQEAAHQRLMGGFTPVPKAKAPLKLDGVLDEADWARAQPLAITEPRQYFKIDNEPMGKWNGPDDLSGSLRFLWDDKYLYVGVDVTDDVFIAHGKADAMWAQDGLQFLIDPYRDRLERKGRYDYAMGFDGKEHQAWCHLSGDQRAPTGAAPDIIVMSVPNNHGAGGRTYEVAIPWSRIPPFVPAPGRDLGAAMILNEDDGKGRGSFLGWFSGVHLKETDYVGDLILGE
jgi:hypothetical protein